MLKETDFIKIDKRSEKLDYGKLNYHVLEGMADWVRVIDEDGIVIYANKAMKDDLGEDIIGRKCYEVICNSKACRSCITNRSMATGEIIQKEEIIQGKTYSVKSSPVKNSKGVIIAAVEVFRNVTRERKLELELINKNRKMNSDLEFSKRLQQKMLPKNGKIRNVNLDYIYKPSETLSGDMFDIYTIDEEHIGVYISDVVGNGVAASLMTMFIRQTMRVMTDDPASPSDRLQELHKRFLSLSLEAEYYFTIFYGILNTRTKKFRYVNAGHNCMPIRYNIEKDIIEVIENKGYPISSLLKKITFKEKEIQIDSGDKILFYTDGVTEARDYSGREFGIERLIDVIKTNPDEMLRSIEDTVFKHSFGEIADDFALMLLEILY
ncbi:SpoIIE family protein phosphatase [Tissierella creatinophila]|uniref:Phosphoserine phosphatase RsbU n=1 Tax=Tissierella creatinophila DSM 6911 TaxID=1123403 RepID=A0A1U7M6W1_TISCR|nr:SpoIIE family protein phosphatase [Tissierella creatinophila]OLS03021.1 phosphoserine phosphatase RsbU [Tissierella creatinophila DSM 6911]